MTTANLSYQTREVASATVIRAGRFVKAASTANHVEECGDGEEMVGIAVDASANGSTRAIAIVDIAGGGVAEVTVGGADVALNAEVASGAEGVAKTATSGDYVAGKARIAGTSTQTDFEVHLASVRIKA